MQRLPDLAHLHSPRQQNQTQSAQYGYMYTVYHHDALQRQAGQPYVHKRPVAPYPHNRGLRLRHATDSVQYHREHLPLL